MTVTILKMSVAHSQNSKGAGWEGNGRRRRQNRTTCEKFTHFHVLWYKQGHLVGYALTCVKLAKLMKLANLVITVNEVWLVEVVDQVSLVRLVRPMLAAITCRFCVQCPMAPLYPTSGEGAMIWETVSEYEQEAFHILLLWFDGYSFSPNWV